MQFFIVSLIAQHSTPHGPTPSSLYYGVDCCVSLPLHSDRLSLSRPTTPSHSRTSSFHSTTTTRCHMPYNGNAPTPPSHRCRYVVDCCMLPVTDASLCIPIFLLFTRRSWIAAPILRPTFNPMPIMMPPAKLAITLEYCVDDIDVIANGIIDG